MSLFHCASCAAKDAHINSLQNQVQMLEKLVFPPRPTQDVSNEEADINYNSDDIILQDDLITRIKENSSKNQ